MRKVIEGKHLGKATLVDTKTGEVSDAKTKMFMLPAAEGKCEWCAVEHPPEMPHDKTSIFYQYRFYNEHGRWPGWKEAMEHCEEHVRKAWTKQLALHGETV